MHKIIPFNASLQKLALSFKCGNEYLDHFLRSADALNECVGQTYVFLTEDESAIIGYYNISTGCIEQNDAGLSFRMGGSVHINDLAVDEKYHGLKDEADGMEINISDILLIDCLDRIKKIQKDIGFAFVTLNSTKQGRSLYERNGFEEIEEDMYISSYKDEIECTPMYLAMELI